MPERSTVRTQLLAGLAEAFEGPGWHGPTLLSSLRGVTPDCAAWRPAPRRHNIWELVVHTAYWKYVVVGRITGAPRGSFGTKGSNWFARPAGRSGPSWDDDLTRLREEHDRLRATVEQLPDAALLGPNARSGGRVDLTVRGIAAHDVYHAGQIQLLKRLWKQHRRPRGER